jgi:cell division protein FtsB
LIQQKYYNYFTGLVFSNKIPLEVGSDETNPELYPVGINLVKMLCTTQADSLFGEWEESIVHFEPKQDIEVGQPEKDATDLASLILVSSSANTILWENALDREVYGGGVIKVTSIPSIPGHIKWSRVPLDCFYPIWDPDDPDILLEAYIVVPMTKEQARSRYGITTNKDIVYRVEHWTTTTYTNKIDGKEIQAFSGANPWGFVPFVFIPRIRSSYWWGDSLTEDLIRVQDELNMRIADLGEAVNYNTHPIKWGYNLSKSFNPKNYPIGPGYFWDGGRVIGQSPEPHIEILEAKNPIPQGTFDYISFLYDWSCTSTFTPAVALGIDSGGGQRSGITLEVRMQPLVRATRRSRAYMAAGLSRAMKMSALMLKQKAYSDVKARALESILRGDITPRFAPLLPRDQAGIVDEVQKGMSTKPPTISIETAVKKLGYGTSEVERIKAMLADEDLYVRENAEIDAKKEMAEQQIELKKEQMDKKTIGMNSGSGNAPDNTEASSE